MSVSSVLERYSAGAKEREEALCCPVDYDRELLKILPQEIIERDYGCGDPSRYVRAGDTVLDLGSGGGKICYMAAQLVGKGGRVIGVDMNDDMLALALKYQKEMQDKTGVEVSFHKGQIQNLEMIEDNTIDLIVSNCVLNLVTEADREQLVSEIHRVLKPGGRVAISDIVSDEHVPEHLKQDENLWSGCISGAFQELDFLDAFAKNGFRAVAYDKWDTQPWQVVEGIEFRSVTLTAIKADPSECIDRGHAVIYRGPYASVWDEEGHEYRRGERMAVCERTYRLITEGPFKDDFIGITPSELWAPRKWCAASGTTRPASETKGARHAANTDISSSGGCC